MSAQILPFTPRPRGAQTRQERGDAAAPAIVIFPGVRYERLADDAMEAASEAVAAQRH